ncbi:MAG: hypothetical protein A3G25_09245 [Betaproteobacteria bacterium RIFCSPLOWO2_12_FULL_63_13]|nr:MAG: hypothetical protein A3G25_09245 [Betaproteobacteria bacterium RIFCSPLOWO2_12_FULL_63_13]
METEIKLLVAPENLGRILRSKALRRCTQDRARTSMLTSIYFDTPRFDLRDARLALRLRRIRTGSDLRWLQALKGGAASTAGLTQREEYEWPVPARRIELALLDTTPYAAVFAKRRVRESLRAVFTTRFRRSVAQLLLADGSRAELCADRGEISIGRARAPISEVEIELKGGNPRALFEFASELLREVPLRLGTMSKAERGYALKRHTPPRKAHAVALRPEMSRAEALQTVARGCLAQIHANEQGFLSGRDPEFLHQLRVGFRRLRVALAMPDDPAWREALEPVRAEMRWLFSVLGPVRNWDVFISEILPPLMQHFGDEEGLSALRARCLRLRRRRLALARQAVSSPRYAALLLAVGALLYGSPPAEPPSDAPAQAFAREFIGRRARVLRKRGAGLATAGPQERHRVRIAAKKLRYSAEFFAALHPSKRLKRYVDALAELQDVLGAINDAALGATMIAELGSGARLDPRLIGMAQGWIAAGEAPAIERLSRAWDAFKRCRSLLRRD